MSAELRCAHCALPVPAAQRGDDDGPQFCCAGCRSVYHLLHEWGLDTFYRRREAFGVQRPESLRPAPAPDEAPEAVVAAAMRERGDGLHEIDWQVGGMHCAACVWLLERLPHLLPGVREARVDFAAARLRVCFDDAQAPPVQQARVLRRLGYHVAPWCPGARNEALSRSRRDWMLRFAVSAAAAIASMHVGLGLFAGHAAGDMDAGSARVLGLLSILLALPALCYGAVPFYRAAWAATRAGRLVLEHSIVLAIVAAVGMSAVEWWRGGVELYADAAAMFIALLLGGRLALLMAHERLAAGDQLVGLMPSSARRIVADGSELVATDRLRAGDLVAVAAGEVLPCDGEVVTGSAGIDAAVLSGEARPLRVDAGDTVAAGTRCLQGSLRLRCSVAGAGTRMGRLLEDVRGGTWRPTERSRLVDGLQRGFVPALLVLALLTWLLWWQWDPSRAWPQTVALILACCPCALGMATPLCYALAARRAARADLLLRDGGAIEVLAGPRHVVFDKTGTLTEGRFRVLDWRWSATLRADERTAIAAAVMGAEQRARHPLAQALVAYLHGEGYAARTVDALEEMPARGVRCSVDGHELRIGARAFCGLSDATAEAGQVAIAVAWDGRPIAELQLADPIKPGIADCLAELRALGAQLHCCSGDASASTAALAARLGFAPERVHGGCSPEAKAAYVAGLVADGRTVMVGDGVNDAPALSAADVGVGLHGGLEAALSVADVASMRSDAAVLRELFAGSRRAVTGLRRALACSLLYNLLAVAAVLAGFWGPYVCAIAMPASSLAIMLGLAASRSFVVSRAGVAPDAPVPGFALGRAVELAR